MKRRFDSKPVQTLFITGTGTGVGKTVLTALLLAHLRSRGVRALGLKPFCSGSRDDAQILYSLQDGELGIDQINPFFFVQPLAPYVAASLRGRRKKKGQQGAPSLAKVLMWMGSLYQSITPKKRAYVLVEGSGGILVPLAKGLSVLDMISALADQVIVVAPNVLGTLNHSLLTVRTLQQEGLKRISIVLMGCKKPDLSANSNADVLSELLPRVPVHSIPFLGGHCRTANDFILHAARHRPTLAEIIGERKSQ